jgi:predicted metalloprotease with PDZ domain
VSYYTKGAVLGFLLDGTIRKATKGRRSLDDAMRLAYQRYSGAKGYTSDELRAVIEEVAGTSLKAFWDGYLEGTSELDYTEALDAFGLRFHPGVAGTRAWLGASTRNDSGRLVVTQVRRDSPAWTAGLNVDDEILAIGDFRVRADRLETRLDQYRPGERVTLLVARREQLQRLELTFGPEPTRSWRVEVDASATADQQKASAEWLK